MDYFQHSNVSTLVKQELDRSFEQQKEKWNSDFVREKEKLLKEIKDGAGAEFQEALKECEEKLKELQDDMATSVLEGKAKIKALNTSVDKSRSMMTNLETRLNDAKDECANLGEEKLSLLQNQGEEKLSLLQSKGEENLSLLQSKGEENLLLLKSQGDEKLSLLQNEATRGVDQIQNQVKDEAEKHIGAFQSKVKDIEASVESKFNTILEEGQQKIQKTLDKFQGLDDLATMAETIRCFFTCWTFCCYPCICLHTKMNPIKEKEDSEKKRVASTKEGDIHFNLTYLS